MVLEKEFSVRKFSGATGCSGEVELNMLLESIDIPLRGLTVVRPVHSTVLSRSHCFQITTPTETRYFSCNSAEDANNWVAGLKSSIYPNRNKEKRVDTSLDVWIFEAKGLPSKKKYYCEIVLDKVLYGRTSTKLKTDILFWGEQFSFDDLPSIKSLSLYVFRENETKKKRKERSVFVGSVEVPLNSIKANNEIETWLNLRPPGTSPKPPTKNSANKIDQLSVRVKVKYQAVSILPISMYKDLHEYVRKNYFVLCKELESMVYLKAKDELAQTLLKILHVTNQAKEFLADIIIAEVTSLENENLTFRGNTLATKSMDTYMKMVGSKYLHTTLAAFVENLYNIEEDFEVDPTKLTGGTIAENQKNLLKFVEEAWSTILSSRPRFPRDLQDTFYLIKQRCESLQKDVSMKLISGSVFLRFLCPAILSPSLFHLTREYPNEKTARCLTLIAKALQNLANFTRFGGKEAYMEGLNEFVEREFPKMKNFLEMISSDADVCGENIYDGYIDIGRELSVLNNIVSEQLTKMNEDTKLKLDPLCAILAQLETSSNMTRTSATVSKESINMETNLTTQSNVGSQTEIETSGKECEIYNNSCYEDALLSGAQDYVSGCSLIEHTSSKKKRAMSQRTKGRAADGNNQLSFSASKINSTKYTHLNVHNFLRANEPTESSSFLRSSSFHGRSSRDERHQHMFKSGRSFDTDKLPSKNKQQFNRNWLSTSESRLRSKSDQTSRTKSTDIKSNPSDAIPSMRKQNSNNSLNAGEFKQFSSDDSSHSASANQGGSGGAGEKTIRRLPDIIHQSIMSNEANGQVDQPLYFSPATEPMTPLGNRQFKFGLDSLDHIQKSYETRKMQTSLSSTSVGNNDPGRPLLSSEAAREGNCEQGGKKASLSMQSLDQTSLPNNFIRSSSNDPVDSTEHYHSTHSIQGSQTSQEQIEPYRMELVHQSLNTSRPDMDLNDESFASAEFSQDQPCSNKQHEGEIKELKRLLREARFQLQSKNMELTRCISSYEQNISSGKRKLEEAERKLQIQKKDKEEQMKSIISRLTNVESELRREQVEMQDIVQAKQKIIEVQERRIKSLDAANKRLVSALNQEKTTNRNRDKMEDEIEGDIVMQPSNEMNRLLAVKDLIKSKLHHMKPWKKFLNVNEFSKPKDFAEARKELSIAQQYSAVFLISIPFLFLASAGSVLFWVIGASAFVILFHASFWQIAEEQDTPELDSIKIFS
eukprot:gene15996-17607_t